MNLEEEKNQGSAYERSMLQEFERQEKGEFDFFINDDNELIARSTVDETSYIFRNNKWEKFTFTISYEEELSRPIRANEVERRFDAAYAMLFKEVATEENTRNNLMRKRITLQLYPEIFEDKFRVYLAKYEQREINRILEALTYVKEKHDDQLRDDGSPYINHCMDAALYAIQNDENADGVIICLLHDVIEDTNTNMDEIEERFGVKVAEKVAALSKYSKITGVKRDDYFGGISGDPELVRYKTYDRLSNVLSLYFLQDSEKKTRYLRETEEQIIPIAEKAYPDLAENLRQAVAFIKKKIPLSEEMTKRLSELAKIHKIKRDLGSSN